MQLLVNVANGKPQLLVDHVAKVQQAARAHPSTLCLAAQVIARVGRLSQVTSFFFSETFSTSIFTPIITNNNHLHINTMAIFVGLWAQELEKGKSLPGT